MANTSINKMFSSLLNTGLAYNVDEEFNNGSGSQVVEALQGDDGVGGAGVRGISKLRARNTALLADTDHRYEGRKVKRADLNHTAVPDYDASLEKFFLDENSTSEDEGQKDSVERKKKKNLLKQKNKLKNKKNSINKQKLKQIKSNKTVDGKLLSSKKRRSLLEQRQENNNIVSEDSSTESEGDNNEDAEEDNNVDAEEDNSEDAEEDNCEVAEEDNSEGTDENESEEEVEYEDESDTNEAALDKTNNFSFKDDGDYSKYADDDEDDMVDGSYDGSTSGDSENDSDDDAETTEEKSRKGTLSTDDEGSEDEECVGGNDVKAVDLSSINEDQQKANAVTKQMDLYDKLFEQRIKLQRVVSSSHQLPQPDVCGEFLLQGETGRYKDGLKQATTATQGLLQALLQLQETILEFNPETRQILREGTIKQTGSKPPFDDDDEEITSSEDESDSAPKKAAGACDDNSLGGDAAPFAGGRKRKRSSAALLEEFEGVLAKRHCNTKQYRDKVVAYWDERTRLLQAHTKSSQSKKKSLSGGSVGAYSAFEEGFGVMVQRILADRQKLVKRTQLRSVRRGNLVAPLGSKQWEAKQEIDEELDIPKVDSSVFERYDPEIYDDTDFYSRYLEELLKMKMVRGTTSMTTAQFFAMTQSLRNKNKKVVDTRRSKGRKLKYDVQSQLVGFFAPRVPADAMEEDMVDMITSSVYSQQSSGKK